MMKRRTLTLLLLNLALLSGASVLTIAKPHDEPMVQETLVPEASAIPSVQVEMPLPSIYIEKTITLKKNETLSEGLIDAGLPRGQVAKALHTLQRKYNMRKLRPGQKITFTYKEGENLQAEQISEITFFTPNDKIVSSMWNEEKETFIADVDKRPTQVKQLAAVGKIQGSLYHSAKRAKLPAALVPAFANLFAWDLDFTRDIHPGNDFKVVYEAIYDDKGNFLRSGNILAAEIHTRKKSYDAYRIVNSRGFAGYYNAKGFNKRKALLRTPLEFTRISSHFNRKRKHPILGYTRAHKGTDFAAPRGTPIRASGDGKVERASWYGGYGRYVRIKHGNGFKTAYAHLHRYGRGIKAGKRVKQGQIIGYVGTSGRSTGPHLHYEVLKNGRHVNPMRVAMPTGQEVPKAQKQELRELVAQARQLWAEAGTQVASIKP